MTEHALKYTGTLLDHYLAMGCYRMGQYIFTTNSIFHNEKNYPVFWLRYPLQNFSFSKKAKKLLSSNNHFKISHRVFSINDEIENLYRIYSNKVNFDAPATLYEYLYSEVIQEEELQGTFDSEMIEVRDGDKLIAVGIYDKGLHSIAGIMNFYDHAYQKYSLGKYMMLLKIQYAMQWQMQFYYPGYIAFGYTKFDYKLFPNADCAQIFDATSKVWLPYSKELLMRLI
jgi:arginine-tRNA-protein transferase